MASDHGCNVEDSRMAVLGNEFAAIMMISGAQNQIEQAEKSFMELSANDDYQVTLKRTEGQSTHQNSIPYTIHAISLDGLGIIQQVTDFLAQQSINIENLQTNSYKAPHTGAPMLEIQMTVNIPGTISIMNFRDEFADMCDELHIDSVVEPL